MKRLIAFLFLIFSFLLVPEPVSAHLAGQPPFFKINDRYSNLYPVPTTSLSGFTLPQDAAAETYLVGQGLTLELVAEMLPVPKEIVEKSKFWWTFGDGEKGSGLKNVHTYAKPGSYILTIDAQAPADPNASLIQSVLINVLPDKNYRLPSAVIKINGRKSKDPLTDVLREKFNEEMEIDGSESKPGSWKIVSYFWDLGDSQSAEAEKLTYTFSNDLTQTFVVLRVKNVDGFIADNYVEVDNQNTLKENPEQYIKNQINSPNPRKQTSENPLLKIVVGASILLALFGGLVIFTKLKKK